jgi:hypothetical protein
VKPDKQDFAAVEKERGPLPSNASEAEHAERYRLAQAAKLIREHAENDRKPEGNA